MDAARAPVDAALARRDGGWGGHALLAWRPLNIAHRGGRRERPEHTLIAYQHALDVGADVLELDLHRTSDGAIVVMHDATVDRTTDGSGAIAEMTLAEIQALDAAYDFGGSDGYPYRGTGVRVPTLAEVLDAFPESLFHIELKAVDEALDRDFVDEIESRSLQSRVAVSGIADAPLARVRELSPTIATAMSAAEMIAFTMVRPTQEARYVPPAPLMAPPFGIVDAPLVAKLHRFGLFLQVWTVNDEADMDAMIDLGVTAIMTDRPTLLEEVLARRGLRGP